MRRDLGSTRAVADKLGVSYQAVAARLRRHFPSWALEQKGSNSGVRYTEEERTLAMRLYIRGIEIDEICAKLGCSRSTVTEWARRDGIGRGVGRRRSYEPAEAAVLYKRLGRLKDVADVLGVSETSVWRALKEVPCSA